MAEMEIVYMRRGLRVRIKGWEIRLQNCKRAHKSREEVACMHNLGNLADIPTFLLLIGFQTFSVSQIAPRHPPRITPVKSSYGFASFASFSTA